jgi:hypothetical protein
VKRRIPGIITRGQTTNRPQLVTAEGMSTMAGFYSLPGSRALVKGWSRARVHNDGGAVPKDDQGGHVGTGETRGGNMGVRVWEDPKGVVSILI